MAKSILKFTLAILLAALLVIVPLLGIPQLGFSGLLTDDDITVSNELKEGQLIRFVLSVNTNQDDEATLKKNADQTAQILRKRLSALGYSESDVSVVSYRDIVLTLPFQADASIVKDKLAITGDFFFKDADGKTILSSADIENCSAYYQTNYDTNGAGKVEYYLSFHLTDKAMKLYTEKTTQIAKSSNKYVQLYVDSTSLSQLSVPEAVTANDFSFGPFSYEDALWYASLINAKPTPQTLAPISYSIEPAGGANAYSMVFVSAAIALVLVAAAMIFVYKRSGICLTLSLIFTLGLTLLLNTAFGLSVNLTGLVAICFAALLCIFVTAVLLSTAKQETAANPYTCFRLALKKKLWFLVDALCLPFAISLAMMWYGNVFLSLFCNLVFIGVMATAASLLITMLTVSALADAGCKKSGVFGN